MLDLLEKELSNLTRLIKDTQNYIKKEDFEKLISVYNKNNPWKVAFISVSGTISTLIILSFLFAK